MLTAGGNNLQHIPFRVDDEVGGIGFDIGCVVGLL
jgi:hypothetical protein